MGLGTPTGSDTAVPEQDEFLAVLGNRVAETRKAAGITQEELAEALDTTVQTISRWERGHMALSLQRLKGMADVLGVGLGGLLDVHRPRPKPNPDDEIQRIWRRLDPKRRELLLRIARNVEDFDPE